MPRRGRRRLPADPVTVTIEGMSHDGRGVASVDGKRVFVEGALAGEQVSFQYVDRRKSYDVGVVCEVHQPSPDRVEPLCRYFGLCGGCQLQHLDPQRQIEEKQQRLLDNFLRIGKVEPEEVVEPLLGPSWGYRRKARLGVKYVPKKGGALVGFRERRKPYIVDMERCEVLHPSIGELIQPLRVLISSLEARQRIAQIEVAVDDNQTALVLRNLDPLSEEDRARLCEFAKQHQLALYLQPGGPESIAPLWPETIDLSYQLPEFGLQFHFQPTDFTQVNREINRQMVARAIDWMEIADHERVLDLFCGLGNFTLPLARHAAEVVGVEGSGQLVARARDNATANGIENARFYTTDLSGELADEPWWQGGFDKVLLDPSRDGAEATLNHLSALGVKRIIYVSCNPATLARDAGVLVNEYGYRLERAGVMDMFPHTAHVESIALFTRA